ncbi:MAG: DNA-binding protein [Parvibaculaceae bacterium]|uniref:DNA-binding protein n=1 Tax=Marinovum TaxID=367771 RepID=UPI00237AEE7F|nr:DNA-binding protein [Marinovum sp. PR37]MDD9746055.1 DNA-binding protein [Marinovum sp. PR37]
MSKHEKSFNPAAEIDPDLLRRTESAILALMAQNDGKMPTYNEINEKVQTSFTRLGPAARMVKSRLMAIETKLANMPEMPEELRLAHEQMLKDLWTRTRDLQNDEIVNLRRAQAAKDESHREEIREMQEVIETLEADRDTQAARAATAEAVCVELQARIEATTTDLAAAHARLAEREEIFVMLASRKSSEADKADFMGEAAAKKSSRRARKPDVPETGNLPVPGISTEPGSDSSE